MPSRTAYVERDRHGNGRIVIPSNSTRGRKSDRELLHESEAREIELEAKIAALQTSLNYAQRDLFNIQNISEEHRRLLHAHNGCRHTQEQMGAQMRNMHAQLEERGRQMHAQSGDARRFEDMLLDEQDKSHELRRKVEKLEEKYRLLKRTSGDVEVWRGKYNEKKLALEECGRKLVERMADVEILMGDAVEKERKIRHRDEEIRMLESRVESRDRDLEKKTRDVLYFKNYLQDRGYRVSLPI